MLPAMEAVSHIHRSKQDSHYRDPILTCLQDSHAMPANTAPRLKSHENGSGVGGRYHASPSLFSSLSQLASNDRTDSAHIAARNSVWLSFSVWLACWLAEVDANMGGVLGQRACAKAVEAIVGEDAHVLRYQGNLLDH